MTRAQRPAPVVPVPATRLASLRGRRVIVGMPGLGWRGDLRADDPVVHGSRTYVPVLTEQDYYRAETEQLEVFAPLVPIDRVWVEDTPPDVAPIDLPGKPATLDAPPQRDPVRPEEAGTITGRRIVQLVPDGEVRDLRAVTEVYRSDAGDPCVRICTEAEWYRWALVGTIPEPTEVRTDRLWLE
jgi:hypothetical protein